MRAVLLRQTLVLLLSCWELPPLSFLSPEAKVTESPGSCLCCGLSPRVGELCKLQTRSDNGVNPLPSTQCFF